MFEWGSQVKREKGREQSLPLCASGRFIVSEGKVRGGQCPEANAFQVTNWKQLEHKVAEVKK